MNDRDQLDRRARPHSGQTKMTGMVIQVGTSAIHPMVARRQRQITLSGVA